MSERGQHWQAIVITVVLHLLPLLLLVHWVAVPPMLPPPEQDVRISLRLLAPATPPQPVEERQADTPSQAQQARASQPTKSPPPPKPTAARSRRQQGTAWVRASIDREGRLLALRLEQSSGQPMLDDAALQTFRRAQPLPPIPDELKAPQELVVPVEYYLR